MEHRSMSRHLAVPQGSSSTLTYRSRKLEMERGSRFSLRRVQWSLRTISWNIAMVRRILKNRYHRRKLRIHQNKIGGRIGKCWKLLGRYRNCKACHRRQRETRIQSFLYLPQMKQKLITVDFRTVRWISTNGPNGRLINQKHRTVYNETVSELE